MKRIAPLLIAVVASLGLSACSTSPYAAKVDDVIIKPSTIDEEVQAITSNRAYAAAIDEQLASAGGLRPGGSNTINSQYVSSLLYDQVLSVLIEKELRARNITVTDAQRTAKHDELRGNSPDPQLFDSLAPGYKNYIVNSQAGLQVLLDMRSNPEAQQKTYADNVKTYTSVCIRQMSVADQASGGAFKAQLEAGGDFATLAQQGAAQAGLTYDPTSAEPQCITENELSAYAASILDPLGVNGVSAPLEVSGGFALVQVTSRAVKPFAEVQEEIRTGLANREELFGELLAKAKIEVNPKYGKYQAGNEESGTGPGISPNTPVALSDDPVSETEGATDGAGGATGLEPGAVPAE